mgnify:CR=1 FL=1
MKPHAGKRVASSCWPGGFSRLEWLHACVSGGPLLVVRRCKTAVDAAVGAVRAGWVPEHAAGLCVGLSAGAFSLWRTPRPVGLPVCCGRVVSSWLLLYRTLPLFVLCSYSLLAIVVAVVVMAMMVVVVAAAAVGGWAR